MAFVVLVLAVVILDTWRIAGRMFREEEGEGIDRPYITR